jgi:hypothetical protein
MSLLHPVFEVEEVVDEPGVRPVIPVVPPTHVLKESATFCGYLRDDIKEITFVDLYNLLHDERVGMVALSTLYQLQFATDLDRIPKQYQREVINFSAWNQKDYQLEYLSMLNTVASLGAIKNVFGTLCKPNRLFEIETKKRNGSVTTKRTAFHDLMTKLGLISSDAVYALVDNKAKVVDIFTSTVNGRVVFLERRFKEFIDPFLVFSDLTNFIIKVPYALIYWSSSTVDNTSMLEIEAKQCAHVKSGGFVYDRVTKHEVANITIVESLSMFHQDGQCVLTDSTRFGSHNLLSIMEDYLKPYVYTTPDLLKVCFFRQLKCCFPLGEVRRFACNWTQDYQRLTDRNNKLYQLIPQPPIDAGMADLKKTNALKTAPKNLFQNSQMSMMINLIGRLDKKIPSIWRCRQYNNIFALTSTGQSANQMISKMDNMVTMLQNFTLGGEDGSETIAAETSGDAESSSGGLPIKRKRKTLVSEIWSGTEVIVEAKIAGIVKDSTNKVKGMTDKGLKVSEEGFDKLAKCLDQQQKMLLSQMEVVKTFAQRADDQHKALMVKVTQLNRTMDTHLAMHMDVNDISEENIDPVIKENNTDQIHQPEVVIKSGSDSINPCNPLPSTTNTLEKAPMDHAATQEEQVSTENIKKPAKPLYQAKSSTRARKKDETIEPGVSK